MDGGHEYGSYQSLFKMEDFDLEKTDVPYCLVVNNYENFSIYPYYNSIITTEKQMYRMPYLDHNGFISYWRFFDSCSAGSATNKISTSYETICDCALHFFNHFLKPDLPKSDEAGLSSSANEYIQPVIQNNASIACLCNLILANHMDSVMCLLDENRTTYLGKENEINILARFLIDHHIDHSIQLYLYNLENHPDSWETLYNLGVAYKEKGEPLLSRSALLKAQELNPQNSDITDLLNE
jgi:tetratricopeptide (TPR) repeat protein